MVGDINIPIDIKLEILKKLPAKSIVRFLGVSKLWKTIIRDYIVKDSIVARPCDPHFILEMEHWSSSSASDTSSATYSFVYTHHQTTHEEEQLSLEETFGGNYCMPEFQYVRGLIGYPSARPHQFNIHNPTTRQSVYLPNTVHNCTQTYEDKDICYFFFGYEPLSNQYKVVCLERNYSDEEFSCRISTVGVDSKNNQWRNIPYGIERHHRVHGSAVCINGVIYYKAMKTGKKLRCFLVSFDVRLERFNHLRIPVEQSIVVATLVDYQGKLGWIVEDNFNIDDFRFLPPKKNVYIELWVLENAERQEWSKITYVDVFHGLPSYVMFAGITHPVGEMVFIGRPHLTKLAPISVYYYDTKVKKFRKVEFKTPTSPREFLYILHVITDHVENILYLP